MCSSLYCFCNSSVNLKSFFFFKKGLDTKKWLLNAGNIRKVFSKGKKDTVTGPQDKHRSIIILHMVN